MSGSIEPISVGFIGAGRIGQPVIRALLAAGYSVTVYDKSKAATDEVIALGATWSETPEQAAKNAIAVITCLARPEHVWECMMGEQNALSGMAKGTTWMNMSTTDYHSSVQIAEAGRAKGILSLEGPVSNISHMGVDFGNSSMYCAGDKEGYDAVKDILEAITEISFFTGAFGTAQAVKLLTNLMFYGSVSICGDCLAISQNAGIPSHWMWEQIKTSRAASIAASQFIPMLLDGSYDTSCSLEIGVKDMSLTVALADELGVPLSLGRVVNARYALAGQMIDQSKNHLVVTKLTEDENDLEIRIPDISAPSQYGRNPQFKRSAEMDIDAFGRATPKFPESYRAPAFQPTANQQVLVDALLDFMAGTNDILNAEALALGKGIGLETTALHRMMIWSVGSNWVLENQTEYQQNPIPSVNLFEFTQGLKLPFIADIQSVL